MKKLMFPSTSSLDLFTTNSINQAAQWLKIGHLLAYPTESVWGVGCDPFNQTAVQQLLDLKHRPLNKGMIVITDSALRIAPLLAALNSEQRQTILNSWQVSPDSSLQQAYTWLLPLPDQLKIMIPLWITGAHDSVAVRVIAHPLIKQLCTQMVSVHNPYGFIVSTSCNPAGQPPALTLQQAQAYFKSDSNSLSESVAYLQGETLGYQLPSQIRDALTGQIVR